MSINIYRSRDEVHMVIKDPHHPGGRPQSGNKMALDNIRERLALHFDVEASLESRVVAGSYQVRIVLPYRAEGGR